MSLVHPVDLAAWQRWQRRQNVMRHTKSWLTGGSSIDHLLTTGGADPDILVAIDSSSPSSGAALLQPTRRLDPQRLAILTPAGLPVPMPAGDFRSHAVTDAADIHRRVPSLRVVLAAGHYLPAGALAFAAATDHQLPYLVVQHGLLTPLAPPLPPGTRLLAWSAMDGEFWRAGRGDIEVEVVGSQLLWEAAQRSPVTVDSSLPPTFLGQLHGAELPRRQMASLSATFCRQHRAIYRPHPSEGDRLSRLQHARWARQGIDIDSSGRELGELGTAVVGVFSTGVLEAAAFGLPAWVYHPSPPAWVSELWGRYGLGPWGGEPTPSPTQPPEAPALRVAAIADRLAGGT